MSKFRSYRLPVSKIHRITDDCVTIEFKVAEKLDDAFTYEAGQFLTIKSQIEDQELRRNYSLCSAPHEKIWQIAVREQPNGRFSVFANHNLREGDILDVYPPMGTFTFQFNSKQTNQYIAFASGSGITPVISLLKSCLQIEPGSHFTLFYGNRDKDHVIFLETLEQLKNAYIDRLSLFYFFSQEQQESSLFNGRINGLKCRELAGKLFDVADISTFFLCGPQDMMHDLTSALIDLGVDKNKIKKELFTSVEMLGNTQLTKQKHTEPANCEIVITVDGSRISYKLSGIQGTILDSALNLGADLPFACKGGVCCSCKAHLIEGEVTMDKCYGLDDEEREKGFILTCQSRPITPFIEVDYDAK